MKRYLTVSQVADMYQTTRTNIREKIERGEIRAVVHGGTIRKHYRIPEDAVDEYERQNLVLPGVQGRAANRKPKPARTIV